MISPAPASLLDVRRLPLRSYKSKLLLRGSFGLVALPGSPMRIRSPNRKRSSVNVRRLLRTFRPPSRRRRPPSGGLSLYVYMHAAAETACVLVFLPARDRHNALLEALMAKSTARLQGLAACELTQVFLAKFDWAAALLSCTLEDDTSFLGNPRNPAEKVRALRLLVAGP